MDIIEKIRADILDDSIALSSVLRTAAILAYELDNPEFKFWVAQEQDGYLLHVDEMPDYRLLILESYGIFTNRRGTFRNVPIPSAAIREDLAESIMLLPLRQGIRSLEGMLDAENDPLHIKWPNDLLLLVQQDFAEKGVGNLMDAWQSLGKNAIHQILDTVRNRLLRFVIELGLISTDISHTAERTEVVKNLFQNCIFHGSTFTEGEARMSIFDQRNQSVGYQFNAAGDINFDSVRDLPDALKQLEALKGELASAHEAGAIEESTYLEAGYNLQKAVEEAQQPEPDRETIVQRLENTKNALGHIAAMSSMIITIGEAIQRLQQIM